GAGRAGAIGRNTGGRTSTRSSEAWPGEGGLELASARDNLSRGENLRMPIRRTPDEAEILLTGGISTPGVVRIGDTVRRPPKPDADRVQALLTHFASRGFEGAPR